MVFSLRRHLDEAVGSKVNSIAKQFVDIKAVDPLTVEITLVGPNADLPTILALHHFMIVQDGTTDFSKGIGTGAFRSEVFEPGVKSIGVRNENYFKAQKAPLDSFEYFAIVRRERPRQRPALGRRADRRRDQAAVDTPRREPCRASSSSKTTVGNYTNLNVRLDMAPGDKAGFVEGMKLLLNRELIQKAALRGFAEIANDQPIPPMSRYHNAELAPRAYDPEKAKALFGKAGVLGQPIPVVASDAATSSIDMAMILQQAGAKIGMKFDVQRVPSDGYWSNYWLKAPVHFGNINPRPTPDIMFSLLLRLERALEREPVQVAEVRRDAARGPWRARLRQAQGDLRRHASDRLDRGGTAIPVFLSNVDALAPKVRGLKPNPLGGQMGYAMAEYIWLEA